MHQKLWIYCLIIILGLSSCRFTTPIFKVKYKETELPDSIYNTKGTWYHYFRISRYGVVGTYTKQVTTDSISHVVKVRKANCRRLLMMGIW